VKLGIRAALATLSIGAFVALAGPAHADVDADGNFADQLRLYNIHGPRDYDAWLAKISCDRLGSGLDSDAEKSARFLATNLPRGTTTAQTRQFLATAVATYGPDLMPSVTSHAAPNG
jgi:hypothetical protein